MKNVIVIMFCGLALICQGCFFLMAGAGAVAIREATDKAVTYKGNVSSVEQGVRRALKSLGAVVNDTKHEEDKSRDRAKVTLRGETFDSEALTVDIEPSTKDTTLVEIRVGRIGSKKRAKEIHATIEKYCKPVDK